MMCYAFLKVMVVMFQAMLWICWAIAMVGFWLIKAMILFVPWVIMEIVRATNKNQVTTH